MKVMITGASGRVGRYLLRNAPSWAEVEILLDPNGPTVEGYPWYRTDISDKDKTVMAVTCSEPEFLIHLAAMTDVDRCETESETAFRINRDGTANIATACKECGAGMLYISTDYVFNGISGPYDELDCPEPICVYGQSKLDGETACTDINEKTAILRISVPFGKRLDDSPHNFISWLIQELSEERSVNIVDDQFTTPCFLEELSDVIWLLAERKIQGIFNYGTSDRLSRYEMALALCEEMNFNQKLVKPVKTSNLHLKAPRPLESGFITGKIANLMKSPPITFREAITIISKNLEDGS